MSGEEKESSRSTDQRQVNERWVYLLESSLKILEDILPIIIGFGCCDIIHYFTIKFNWLSCARILYFVEKFWLKKVEAVSFGAFISIRSKLVAFLWKALSFWHPKLHGCQIYEKLWSEVKLWVPEKWKYYEWYVASKLFSNLFWMLLTCFIKKLYIMFERGCFNEIHNLFCFLSVQEGRQKCIEVFLFWRSLPKSTFALQFRKLFSNFWWNFVSILPTYITYLLQ